MAPSRRNHPCVLIMPGRMGNAKRWWLVLVVLSALSGVDGCDKGACQVPTTERPRGKRASAAPFSTPLQHAATQPHDDAASVPEYVLYAAGVRTFSHVALCCPSYAAESAHKIVRVLMVRNHAGGGPDLRSA